MKKLFSKLLIAAMAGIVSFSLAGCGAPTVDLNEYISVNTSGYNGYGKLYASVDYGKIVEDYRGELNPKAGNQILGADTPAVAAELAFDMYEPFELEFNASENLENDDKIEIKWEVNESAIKRVQEYLDVNFKYDDFTHKVEGLAELKQVDPFEYVEMQYWGPSGNAEVSTYVNAEIPHDNGTLKIKLNIPYLRGVSNGDIIHVSLNDSHDAEYYAKNYGMVLTRNEADIVVEGADYYPLSDPREIFDYLSEEDFENAETAVLEHFAEYKGDISAEFVGAVFYYSDELNHKSINNNSNNILFLIWHMNNGMCPGGWYTYMGVVGDVYIGHVKQDDDSLVKMTVQGGSPFGDSSWNYKRETVTYYGTPDCPTHFEYDGMYYAGHQTIEECLEAIEINQLHGIKNLYTKIPELSYEGMIVTDSLKDYIN